MKPVAYPALIEVPPEDAAFRHLRLVHRTRKFLRGLDVQAVDPYKQAPLLLSGISELIGSPIDLEARSLSPRGPFAATLLDDQGIVIYFEQAATLVHQVHNVAHELGHLVCGSLMENPDEELFDAHRRGDYSNVIEHDAEVVASLVMSWANLAYAIAPVVQSSPQGRHLAAALQDKIQSI